MKKVLVLTTVITLIGASHRNYGMEQETAFTRKFDITHPLSLEQIRESQKQILDSVNSQESDCTKKFDAITPLHPDQILETQEQSLDSQDADVKREFEAIPKLTLQQIIATNERSSLTEDCTRKQLEKFTRDLKQTELLLLDAQKKDLPQKEHHALLITTYNCLEKIRKQFGCEDTKKLSPSDTMLGIILGKQLETQVQELKLLAEEINHISPAELKKQ